MLFRSNVPENISQLKAKYDAQIVAHKNSERKLEDTERILEKEREKGFELKEDLLKGINIERVEKQRYQQQMEKLHENFALEEIKLIEQVQYLELRKMNLENARMNLIVVFIYA